MKKILLYVSVLSLCIALCGCVSIFGGMHQRELGDTVFLLTDGDQEYLKYSVLVEEGYIELDEDTFKLANGDLEEGLLNKVDSTTETILSGVYLGNSGHSFDCKEGYDYLLEQLTECLNKYKYLEYIFLKNGDVIYGAVNCYKRTSGRSGTLLSYEDLTKSYLVVLEDNELKLEKEIDKTAILAFNKDHYLAYKDKVICSVNKDTGEQIMICDDIWWDEGPTYYSFVNVSFVDNVFVICASKRTSDSDYNTVIVGDISGKHVETLIDNRIAEK